MRTHPSFGMTTTKTLRSVFSWRVSCIYRTAINSAGCIWLADFTIWPIFASHSSKIIWFIQVIAKVAGDRLNPLTNLRQKREPPNGVRNRRGTSLAKRTWIPVKVKVTGRTTMVSRDGTNLKVVVKVKTHEVKVMARTLIPSQVWSVFAHSYIQVKKDYYLLTFAFCFAHGMKFSLVKFFSDVDSLGFLKERCAHMWVSRDDRAIKQLNLSHIDQVWLIR